MDMKNEEMTQVFDNLNGNAGPAEAQLAPTPANVRAAIEEFDRENETGEAALQALFTAFPFNTTRQQVFLKATALNALYSTNIPLYRRTRTDLYDTTELIYRNGAAIDNALSNGVADVVDLIA
jgi:hypothetical protein